MNPHNVVQEEDCSKFTQYEMNEVNILDTYVWFWPFSFLNARGNCLYL